MGQEEEEVAMEGAASVPAVKFCSTGQGRPWAWRQTDGCGPSLLTPDTNLSEPPVFISKMKLLT